MSAPNQLDRYLPERIRLQIEERYLLPINQKARLEQAIRDPDFFRDIEHCVSFFSDHGVVHARDVADQILRVLDTVHGVLIPRRDPSRLEFMRGYGVILAFVHDIGMVDFSACGRAMHPEYATQAVLSPKFDDMAQALWDENCANLAWRLGRLAEQGALVQQPATVLREMLALATCHSKSKVPVEVLSDAAALRSKMQERAGTDLDRLYGQDSVETTRQALIVAQRDGDPERVERSLRLLREAEAALDAVCRPGASAQDQLNQHLGRLYADFQQESFLWLVSEQAETRVLVEDVVDTLRALRCADALRQRGTVLKTSGGYEVFVDQRTGHAIFALRLGPDALYLLELTDRVAVGEANMAASELDLDGNLRVSFHRGAFADQAAIRRAAANAALVVNGIQADVIESFWRPASPSSHEHGLKDPQASMILLEGVDDNLEFAELVWQELERINPGAAARARCVPSLQGSSPRELDRYLAGRDLDWDAEIRQEALERISFSGQRTETIDPIQGFRDTKLIRLAAGEILVEAGAPSGFVYVPLGDGLQAQPLGGYAPAFVSPWVPLGVTGVIRGAARNATVIAQEDVTLLMIPKEVYLRQWYRAYNLEELEDMLEKTRRVTLQREEEATLTRAEKAVILESVPLFSEVPSHILAELATLTEELQVKAGQTIFRKWDLGSHMYIIVRGSVRVHDGDQTLDYLESHEVFGEMALLDPAPRMASVTAAADGLLLRLGQEPLSSLVTHQPEVAQGIIRVLSRHLRAKAQDVTALQARLGEQDEVRE